MADEVPANPNPETSRVTKSLLPTKPTAEQSILGSYPPMPDQKNRPIPPIHQQPQQQHRQFEELPTGELKNIPRYEPPSIPGASELQGLRMTTEAMLATIGAKMPDGLEGNSIFYVEYMKQFEALRAIFASSSQPGSLEMTPKLAQAALQIAEAKTRDHIFMAQQQQAIDSYNPKLERAKASDLSDKLIPEIYNTKGLRQEGERAIREALLSGRPLSAILFDLDGFKTVNDTYGHSTGDEVLIKFAEQLRKIAREDDILGRLGGDEFLLIIKARPNELLQRLLEFRENQMPDELNNLLKSLGFNESRVTTSIGVAELDDTTGSFAALTAKADADMYRDKTERRAGR